MNGHQSVVQFLLKNNANVRVRDKTLRNPLHWACRFNNTKIAELLLDHRCSLHHRDADGKTPLELAALYNNYLVEKFILEYEKNKKFQEAKN